MLRNIHRIILILMLALVMVSGSFIVSMASSEVTNSSDINAATDNSGKSSSESKIECSDKSDKEESDIEDNDTVKKSEPKAETVSEDKSEEVAEPEVVSEPEVFEDNSNNNSSDANKGNSDSVLPENDVKPDSGNQQETSTSTVSQPGKNCVDLGDKPEVLTPATNTTNENKIDDDTSSNDELNNTGPQADKDDQDTGNSDKEPPAPKDPTDRWKVLEPEVDFDTVENIGGHNISYFIDNEVEPTCETAGSYDLVRRCRNKGCKLENSVYDGPHHKILPALGHDMGVWSDWEVIKAATTTTEGLKECHRHCKRCEKEETLTVVIPIINDKKPPQGAIEEVVEVTPNYVRISENGNEHLAEVNEKGVARFTDFFWAFDSETAEENVTLEVNGKQYSFTRLSNGTILGTLPPGFVIDGNDLIINGVVAGMNITSNHDSISFITEVPAPEIEKPKTAVLNNFTDRPGSTGTNRAATSNSRIPVARATGAASMDTNYTNSVADAVTEVLTGRDSSADKSENNGISTLLPSSGLESDNVNSGLAAYILLVIDLALALGLIIGLGVLWKMKVIKF